MGDVVLLRVESDVLSRVIDRVELLDDLRPRSFQDVFEDDDPGLMLLDVLKHTIESST